jgi:hypothetical protein
MSSRVCYFKNASALANYALSADVTSSLSAKADNSAVALKADITAVALKADSSAVNTSLGLKADASALQNYALTTNVDSAISESVSAKLDTTVFTSARGKVNAVFGAIADSLYVESAPQSGVEFNWAANQL